MKVSELFNKIKYVEWLAIIVSAIFQITWIFSAPLPDYGQLYSLLFLTLLFLLAAVPVQRLSINQLTLLMVCEVLIATTTMLFGAHRMYGLLMLVIAGKLAVVLEKRRLLAVAALFIVAHTVAFFIVRWHHHYNQTLAQLEQQMNAVVLFESQLFFICSMVIAVMFGRVLVRELESRRAAEKLAREIETMTIAVERSRMARDMHDSIGHSLTSLNIQLELTEKLLETGDSKQARASLKIARDAASNSLQEVRNTVRAIRDEDFSLRKSIDEITERIGEQQSISFNVDINEQEISQPCRHNLLLILQECLTNIQKHSEATSVSIKLNARDRQALLSVQDNGRGFMLDPSNDGCGIKGLMERARILGGVADIQTSPGNGTAVTVKLPT